MRVNTLKTIRESLGYNHYVMAQKLGLTQSSYKYLEETARTVRLDILIKAFDLSGLTIVEFWDLIRLEAEATIGKDKRGRKKKKR